MKLPALGSRPVWELWVHFPCICGKTCALMSAERNRSSAAGEVVNRATRTRAEVMDV